MTFCCPPGKFVNEGLAGYVTTSPVEGLKIYRLSKKNYGSRLVTEAQKDNVLAADQGWHLNGPMPFHFTSGE
ncbi:hypothetical protein [Nonomuraea sp. KM90]|uniref:hypothetical protein n=1 Tax=Nonomuraea sp. KM90 TaxID=3457428 RepID=UPI003FCE8143